MSKKMTQLNDCKFCLQFLDYQRVILTSEKELNELKEKFAKQCHKFDTYESVMYGKFIEDVINRFGLDSDTIYNMLENRQNEALEIIENYKSKAL